MSDSAAVDDTVRARMAAVAAGELGILAKDVAINRNEELDRAGCRFFTASSTAQPVHQVSNFATLPDGRIAGVDPKGNVAAAVLLGACGADAPADWWAGVLARFSDDVSGLVLTADGNPFAIRKVRDAGAAFAPPTLKRAAGGTSVAFFVMDVALNRPSQVRATLAADGKLAVETKALSPATNAAPPR